ncbi:MAG TPA: hypothetical protein VNO75_07160 [Gemmatimonadaceae bacterium]|nr:hypothetical protein [Gemmatimonadaceae bacterium]
MRVDRTTLVCTLVTVTLIACSRARPTSDALLVAELTKPEPVLLQVQNNNWADVIIYLVHDGRRSRLNSVTATKTSEMLIPAKLIGQVSSIQLVAREIGGRERYVTQTISVRTGATIILTLESDLRRSSVAIW